MPDIVVNVVTSQVQVNTQNVECDVFAPPIEVEINCCGGGVLGVPTAGDAGDVLTKTGSGATDYEWLPPGAATDLETWTAGENLSAGRVVIIDGSEAFYFQPSDSSHGGRAYGITVTSATAGNDVSVQKDGIVTDAAFAGFSDEQLFVNADGELLTTWPGSGNLLQKAGIAIGANKVKIDFSIQIQQI